MAWFDDIPEGIPAAQAPKDRIIDPPSLVLTPKNAEKYYRKHVSDGYKCKSVGSYALIKSMFSPYIAWQKLVIRGKKMYATVAVCGGFGNSLVLWVPEEGAYVHDLELCLIDGTKVDVNYIPQGNFFVEPKHIFDLAKNVYLILLHNDEKNDIVERFNTQFELIVVNNIMEVCQPAIFKDAKDSDYILELEYGGNYTTCYFCDEQMIVRDHTGIHYKFCKCRDTYIFSRMRSLVCMFHAVRPDAFEEETKEKIDEDGSKYEKTIYKYTLDNHTYRLSFGVSKMKIDDADFGTWTRGQYLSIKEIKERNDAPKES